MIKSLTKRTDKALSDLLIYLKNNKDEDFYLTENNQRYYINDYYSLKKLLRNTTQLYISDTNKEVDGTILLWKSKGGNVSRTYVKINSLNKEIANKLITVLLWNHGQELFIKLRKDSPFLELFKRHNFEWFHNRGSQILLKRRKDIRVIEQIKLSRKRKEVLD